MKRYLLSLFCLILAGSGAERFCRSYQHFQTDPSDFNKFAMLICAISVPFWLVVGILCFRPKKK